MPFNVTSRSVDLTDGQIEDNDIVVDAETEDDAIDAVTEYLSSARSTAEYQDKVLVGVREGLKFIANRPDTEEGEYPFRINGDDEMMFYYVSESA